MNRKPIPATARMLADIPDARESRRSHQLSLSLVLGLLASAAGSVHAEAYLPAIGGNGGSQFKESCAANENLTGFELRTGDDIDAIRPVCVISSGPREINAPPLTDGSASAPGWHGGPGGSIQRLLCPSSTPIVIGMDIGSEGIHDITVNNIYLFCGQAVAEQTAEGYPSAIFDAPRAQPDEGVLGIGSQDLSIQTGSQRCPDGQVATGLHGRTGVWVDAIGLICDVPRLTHYTALGRVQSTSPSGPPRPICDVARDARAQFTRSACTGSPMRSLAAYAAAATSAQSAGSNEGWFVALGIPCARIRCDPRAAA